MHALAPDLVEKIERRARKAFRTLDKGRKDHVHRISDLTATSCTYRLPHKTSRSAYSGTKVTVTRGDDGAIVVPTALPATKLDLLSKSDVTSLLKDHVGTVRAYKATKKDGTGTQYPSITYEVGKDYEEKKAVTDEGLDCAAGINLADLEWVKKERPKDGGRIFAVEFEAPDDLAAVPTRSDGKFRAFRCKVVEELEIDDRGDVKPARGIIGRLKDKLMGKTPDDQV